MGSEADGKMTSCAVLSQIAARQDVLAHLEDGCSRMKKVSVVSLSWV